MVEEDADVEIGGQYELIIELVFGIGIGRVAVLVVRLGIGRVAGKLGFMDGSGGGHPFVSSHAMMVYAFTKKLNRRQTDRTAVVTFIVPYVE